MKQTTLRLPEDLYRKLAVAAKRARRSWNAHVVYILEHYEPVSDGGLPGELGSLDPTVNQEAGK